MQLHPRSWIHGLLLFLALFLIYGMFRQERDWNTASRMLLTAALVQDSSIEVTPYVTSGGRILEHPLTRDLAVNDSQQ